MSRLSSSSSKLLSDQWENLFLFPTCSFTFEITPSSLRIAIEVIQISLQLVRFLRQTSYFQIGDVTVASRWLVWRLYRYVSWNKGCTNTNWRSFFLTHSVIRHLYNNAERPKATANEVRLCYNLQNCSLLIAWRNETCARFLSLKLVWHRCVILEFKSCLSSIYLVKICAGEWDNTMASQHMFSVKSAPIH